MLLPQVQLGTPVDEYRLKIPGTIPVRTFGRRAQGVTVGASNFPGVYLTSCHPACCRSACPRCSARCRLQSPSSSCRMSIVKNAGGYCHQLRPSWRRVAARFSRQSRSSARLAFRTGHGGFRGARSRLLLQCAKEERFERIRAKACGLPAGTTLSVRSDPKSAKRRAAHSAGRRTPRCPSHPSQGPDKFQSQDDGRAS